MAPKLQLRRRICSTSVFHDGKTASTTEADKRLDYSADGQTSDKWTHERLARLPGRHRCKRLGVAATAFKSESKSETSIGGDVEAAAKRLE